MQEKLLNDKVPQVSSEWFSCSAPRTNAAQLRTSHSAGLVGWISNLRSATSSCSGHYLPVLGTSFAYLRCSLLWTPGFTLQDKKLSAPISSSQELLLPLLFKLRNLLQRISLARNSQVSACIWIPPQKNTWMDSVLSFCSVQSRLTPSGFSPIGRGKRGCTELPEHADFQSCQRTDKTQSYTLSLPQTPAPGWGICIQTVP